MREHAPDATGDRGGRSGAGQGRDAPDLAAEACADARTIAVLLAVDPVGLGGLVLAGGPGGARDGWLDVMFALAPADTPMRRMPASIAEDRLLGGLDLSATLASGKPVAQRGLVADADGGIVVASMAERLTPASVAILAAALDSGTVRSERDGLSLVYPARIAVVALDESLSDEAGVAAALADRLAFRIDCDGWRAGDLDPAAPGERAEIAEARRRLASVTCPDAVVESLVSVASALGIGSLRAPLFAVRAARAVSATWGESCVGEDAAKLAARLVLAHRATRWPATADESDAQEPPPEPGDDAGQERDRESEPEARSDHRLDDVVLEAVAAALPADLLQRFKAGERVRPRGVSAGAANTQQKAATRGRVIGVRRGVPRGGERLAVLDTLRAAAPWQRVRRPAGAASESGRPKRLVVMRDDFRIKRYRQDAGATIVFLVDASGSSAINRLAEAKGAVELLLADCYVRRDEVALIAFRNQTAELLLPPTRSLARAKRSLAALPGGGATPLAAGLEAALGLCAGERRRGREAVLVVLSDGGPNIARDGRPGRPQAQADAITVGRLARTIPARVLIIDAAQRPVPFMAELAEAMGADLIAMPHSDARAISGAVGLVGLDQRRPAGAVAR
ncbi:MAG: magnesium chelatase subunit D [Hyphomicrobiaceae bacterium]|nr:magnesium chelatase subunit D [Hyphomicrobiaceae bacterium]